MDSIIESDVLVIGGGLAGCRAALKARELTENVVLVDKGVVGRTGNTVCCHIILAPTPEEEIDEWLKEFVAFTEYLGDQKWVEILLREHPERLKELEDWGVPLIRDNEGCLVTDRCRGMKDICKGVMFDERFWMDHVRQKVISQGVKLVPRVMITDLLTSDGQLPTSGRITGAVGFDVITGGFLIFKTGAVILATGPMRPVLKSHGCNMTGDGQAMAFRVGAEMTNFEFGWSARFQTALPAPPNLDGSDPYVIIGRSLVTLQNHGAYFINKHGERYIKNYFPGRTEQSLSLDDLGRASFQEMLKGNGPLYFDMRHWSPETEQIMRRTIPDIMDGFDQVGINMLQQPIEFRNVVVGWGTQGNGGINVNVNGETNIPGLFACGVSANAMGGAEVFASVSQANCNVFGYRTGNSAGNYVLSQDKAGVHAKQVAALRETALGPLNRIDGVSADQLFHTTSFKALPHEYSMYKHESRIKEALTEMERIETEMLPKVSAPDIHELVKANAARNFLKICQLWQLASLERKESRLSHYREEYPYRDDINWLKWIILKRDDGQVSVSTRPIPIDQYRIKPELREKIPVQLRLGADITVS